MESSHEFDAVYVSAPNAIRHDPELHTQGSYDIRFDWGLAGIEAAANDSEVVVVVDVLSFSTAVDVAVARGARVYPYAHDYGSAQQFAHDRQAMLALRRNEATAENPYTMSPASLRALPQGARLILPSPNGAACCTLAMELGAKQIVIACLRNAKAASHLARSLGKKISVVAAGERWSDGTLRPAVEDLLGAGAILAGLDAATMSPEGTLARRSYQYSQADLHKLIWESVSARELRDASFEEDVRLALEVDASSTVAILDHDHFVGRVLLG
ncbi:MAG: hypothetical protein NVSMB31_00250 [Vulcanimicrobiaceae bacterium]